MTFFNKDNKPKKNKIYKTASGDRALYVGKTGNRKLPYRFMIVRTTWSLDAHFDKHGRLKDKKEGHVPQFDIVGEIDNDHMGTARPPETGTKIFRRKVDKEIVEIHAQVDHEIYDRHGSMEAYGKHIMEKMMKGEWGWRL